VTGLPLAGSARRRSHLGGGRACGRPRAGRLRRGVIRIESSTRLDTSR
jgi:hypothetical protein